MPKTSSPLYLVVLLGFVNTLGVFSETEMTLMADSDRLIAGVDEVGRGALAGPVVVASALFERGIPLPEGIRDSKKLTPKRREALFCEISRVAVAYAFGLGTRDEIDLLGIRKATLLAMTRSLSCLPKTPDLILVDGRDPVRCSGSRCKAVVRGDDSCKSIGAASILAKVFRDDIMCSLDEKYPGFLLAKHKGYGTQSHKVAIERMGLSPCHRLSFKIRTTR